MMLLRLSALSSAVMTHRAGRALTLLVAGTVGVATGVTGAGTTAERVAAGWSAALRRHPASGQLHIVEVDARSIVAIDRWPWSRAEHARVIDRLRQAGVDTIAFDVDFSSRSDGSGDAALAAALRRADGHVVLPTMRQAAGSNGTAEIDSLPAPELRDHAQLATVSVQPDNDGKVRAAPIGTVTAGTPRPSLSAMLAARNGQAGDQFPIDFAIDPGTIPRHSFIDIRDGRFDPAALRGRHVLIGATAVELGDRYAVPNYGVIPGVAIQALAAETLMAGVPVRIGWPLVLLATLAAGWLILRQRRNRAFAAACVASAVALFAAAVGLQALFGLVLELVPALAMLGMVSLIGGALRLERVWRERRLRDEATGLPNRPALVQALRNEPTVLLVVARVSEFERLAAGLSPESAATLLLRVADRLRLIGPGVDLHRINDGVLAWNATVDVSLIGDRYAQLRALMLSPVEVDGRRIDVSVTIGVAEGEGRRADRVIAQAALAAEQAQVDGSGWHLHTSAEEEAVDRDLSLLGELNEGLERGELQVVYQPKLALAAGRIASVEALIRWQHPTRGFLRPDLFIPLAERNDRIAGLTLFVVRRTIADLQHWAAAGHPITGAVNLSAKLLSSPGFNADLIALLEETNIAPDRLIFEVTESAAMTDPDAATAALDRFRELGIAISMDDYGTGQSTLSYLKQLPLNELKIDRSFVQHAHQNRGDAILVRSTIDLAHELGLKVVAEGVEDEACLAFLRSVGCDLAQGYLISKPIAADAIADLLRKWTKEAA
ncbi:EAL domain, c-di-GMP-specific phosphodiesterase class I (or its enzymatically inactive variant) [Sphingomonas guangdongensis]|uniref:EAL domain, c-di-GMP-specific phosphodiesterase class I (Or its enzymatically inactive variant) n=1 Tax=Sphingomonas guangdongensis TaxID=1141890 RepID=A0A285R248_9SPHN|nr:EAL domain-containing protein [Sphingomonas guangdongensis]SOB88180.1 EAL domain, c-di-GMP-specific phosphodiesterase class I (or its enzymatically inactive variant) [Sphingomonas guangdongensis]